jgi:hypothetical protein
MIKKITDYICRVKNTYFIGASNSGIIAVLIVSHFKEVLSREQYTIATACIKYEDNNQPRNFW